MHVDSRELLCEIPAEKDEHTLVSFAPSLKYAAAVHGPGRIDLWDLDCGERLHRMEHEDRRVSGVVFSPDDRVAISVTYAHIIGVSGIVWDLETGEKLSALGEHDGPCDIWDAAITPDGRRLVTPGKRGMVKVWSVPDGREILALSGHDEAEWVMGVAVTPDGRRIVSASWDRSLHVWDIEDGHLVASFGTDSQLVACAVDHGGRRIAVGDRAGQVHLFCLEGVE
jgi:WD40 repeat protein